MKQNKTRLRYCSHNGTAALHTAEGIRRILTDPHCPGSDKSLSGEKMFQRPPLWQPQIAIFAPNYIYGGVLAPSFPYILRVLGGIYIYLIIFFGGGGSNKNPNSPQSSLTPLTRLGLALNGLPALRSVPQTLHKRVQRLGLEFSLTISNKTSKYIERHVHR